MVMSVKLKRKRQGGKEKTKEGSKATALNAEALRARRTQRRRGEWRKAPGSRNPGYTSKL
jgi:hypothetical protein